MPSRRRQHPDEATSRERLRHRVTQVPGELAERSPGPLDTPVLQRSQLGQATILRRTFLPDAARLPSAAQRASALQPGATVAQGDPRRVQAFRAGTAVGDVVAAPTGRKTEGAATPAARQARAFRAGTRGLARPGDLTREQIQQLGLRQQEYLAAEPELAERQHGGRMAATALPTAAAAPRWPLARASGSGQGRAYAHTERRGRR